jgi:putative transcriptional regulator
MSNIYDDILEELKEIGALGTGHLRKSVRTYAPVTPVKVYTGKQIRQMREQFGYTQSYFGELMGVSIKTIQAWEAGTNKPSGTASRFLQVLEQDAHAFDKFLVQPEGA